MPVTYLCTEKEFLIESKLNGFCFCFLLHLRLKFFMGGDFCVNFKLFWGKLALPLLHPRGVYSRGVCTCQGRSQWEDRADPPGGGGGFWGNAGTDFVCSFKLFWRHRQS